MSDFAMGDIADILNVSQSSGKRAQNSTSAKAGQGLEMDDFLMLMVATLQNQSIDDTADTSDMLNQMVQMSMITAMNNISSLVTESTSLTYAASLVGKYVTVGIYEGNVLKEIYGEVTGTGTLNGRQVIFMGDDIYYLTDVMAVGKLPASDEEKAAAGAGSKPEGSGDDGYREEEIDGETVKVYPGADGEFGGADDYYIKEIDGVPVKVYAGADGKFGTPDDYYVKVNDDEEEKVERGEDGKFGVKDPDPDPNLTPGE